MIPRSLPITWWDLITFDREWIKNKTIKYYKDVDGTMKPRVFDTDGNQVYPEKNDT